MNIQLIGLTPDDNVVHTNTAVGVEEIRYIDKPQSGARGTNLREDKPQTGKRKRGQMQERTNAREDKRKRGQTQERTPQKRKTFVVHLFCLFFVFQKQFYEEGEGVTITIMIVNMLQFAFSINSDYILPGQLLIFPFLQVA